MGQLNIPASSRVYLDTSILIYSVEKIPDYFSLLEPMWLQVESNEIQVVTSELSITEALVVPFRNNDNLLVRSFERLLFSSKVQLIPINQEILREAAHLRSQTSLKTPDAIHAASHFITSCNLFLTNDKGFRNVPNLSVVVLSEVLAQ